MLNFNQKRLKNANRSANAVAKKMTALSNASHIFTEDEVKEKSFEGKDMDLFLTAIDSLPIDESNDLRMWASTTDLKALRESFGLSQGQLAKKLGVKQPTICTLENHKTTSCGASLALLEKLHDFYEHPINKQESTSVTTVPAFVKTLRSLWKKAGLSYVEVACKTNIPRSTIYSIVKGEVKKESKSARALKAFLKDYIKNSTQVEQPQQTSQPDAHFLEVRDFCMNHLEEALEGKNRKEVADELGINVSFFSKCIRAFDEKYHRLTPSLEKIYNYFTSPCEVISVPQLEVVPQPQSTSRTFEGDDLQLIYHLVDVEIVRKESQLEDELQARNYTRVSTLAKELEHLNALKGGE